MRLHRHHTKKHYEVAHWKGASQWFFRTSAAGSRIFKGARQIWNFEIWRWVAALIVLRVDFACSCELSWRVGTRRNFPKQNHEQNRPGTINAVTKHQKKVVSVCFYFSFFTFCLLHFFFLHFPKKSFTVTVNAICMNFGFWILGPIFFVVVDFVAGEKNIHRLHRLHRPHRPVQKCAWKCVHDLDHFSEIFSDTHRHTIALFRSVESKVSTQSPT